MVDNDINKESALGTLQRNVLGVQDSFLSQVLGNEKYFVKIRKDKKDIAERLEYINKIILVIVIIVMGIRTTVANIQYLPRIVLSPLYMLIHLILVAVL